MLARASTNRRRSSCRRSYGTTSSACRPARAPLRLRGGGARSSTRARPSSTTRCGSGWHFSFPVGYLAVATPATGPRPAGDHDVEGAVGLQELSCSTHRRAARRAPHLRPIGAAAPTAGKRAPLGRARPAQEPDNAARRGAPRARRSVPTLRSPSTRRCRGARRAPSWAGPVGASPPAPLHRPAQAAARAPAAIDFDPRVVKLRRWTQSAPDPRHRQHGLRRPGRGRAPPRDAAGRAAPRGSTRAFSASASPARRCCPSGGWTASSSATSAPRRAGSLEGVDGVVHLAGVSNDPIGTTFEDATLDVNHRATVALAAPRTEAGASSFVFASSCSVYGLAEEGLRTEESETGPLTAYAKLEAAAPSRTWPSWPTSSSRSPACASPPPAE